MLPEMLGGSFGSDKPKNHLLLGQELLKGLEVERGKEKESEQVFQYSFEINKSF